MPRLHSRFQEFASRWSLPFVCGLLVCALLTRHGEASLPDPVLKSLDTERLTLRGKDGNVLGLWGANPNGNGSSLILFDQNHVPRAGLYASNDSDVMIDLKDAKGRASVRLGVLGNGVPLITLLGSKEEEAVVSLQVSPDGSSQLHVGNTEKKNRLSLSSEVNGDTFFSLAAANGQQSLTAYSRNARENGVFVYDGEGKPAIGIRAAAENPQRAIVIKDKQGATKIAIGLDHEQKPLSFEPTKQKEEQSPDTGVRP